MHRIAAVVPAVVAVLLLAACARQSDGAPTSGGGAARPSSPAGPQADPRTLLGSWTLAEVAEDAGATVTIEPDRLSIERSCGALTGSWRADASGLFVGHVYGSSGCQPLTEPAPGWLLRAAAFRPDGTDRLLVAPDGTVVARLRPVASPDAPAPTLTEQQQRDYRVPAALPRNLVPAGRQALVGRWSPASGRGTGWPYLELLEDGAWRGSDGCNGQGGRWVSGADGALLSAVGPSTLMGCSGVPVGAWMVDVRRAGLDGGSLVLLDVDGKEIGRLRRDK
jgi:hypothetical protein